MLNKLGIVGIFIGVLFFVYQKIMDIFFTKQTITDNTKENTVNTEINTENIVINMTQEEYDKLLANYNKSKSDPSSNK